MTKWRLTGKDKMEIKQEKKTLSKKRKKNKN